MIIWVADQGGPDAFQKPSAKMVRIGGCRSYSFRLFYFEETIVMHLKDEGLTSEVHSTQISIQAKFTLRGTTD